MVKTITDILDLMASPVVYGLTCIAVGVLVTLWVRTWWRKLDAPIPAAAARSPPPPPPPLPRTSTVPADPVPTTQADDPIDDLFAVRAARIEREARRRRRKP